MELSVVTHPGNIYDWRCLTSVIGTGTFIAIQGWPLKSLSVYELNLHLALRREILLPSIQNVASLESDKYVNNSLILTLIFDYIKVTMELKAHIFVQFQIFCNVCSNERRS